MLCGLPCYGISFPPTPIRPRLQLLAELGVLPESYRDTTQLCGGLEQLRMRVQCTGRDMASDTPL